MPTLGRPAADDQPTTARSPLIRTPTAAAGARRALRPRPRRARGPQQVRDRSLGWLSDDPLEADLGVAQRDRPATSARLENRGSKDVILTRCGRRDACCDLRILEPWERSTTSRWSKSCCTFLECGHGLTRPKPSVTYNGHLEGDRCSLLQAAPVAESTANVAFSGMNSMHRDGIQRNAQQTPGAARPRNPGTTNQRCVEEDAAGLGTRWSFRSFSVD